MEQLNNNFLVVDGRLKQNSKIPFAVYQGAQSVNKQVFQSTSSSSNNINWNVQVPSQNVIVDRNVLVRSELVYTVTGPAAANANAFAAYVVDLLNGVEDANDNLYKRVGLAHFPLHHHINSTSVQINNATVSQNSNEVLDTIVRCLPLEDLAWHSQSVNLPDYYFDNDDPEAVDANASEKVLRMFGNYSDPSFKPNIYGRNTNVSYAVEADTTTRCTVSVEVVEPLMISPFTFDENEHEGLSGITNIIVNLTLNPNQKRVFRSCNLVWGTDLTDITLTGVPKSELLFTFLSPKPSQVPTNARNVCSYYELRSYTRDLAILTAGTTATTTSDSMQLSVIPDAVMIYVKPRNIGNADLASDIAGARFGETYGKINSISINFNNNAGLLSSADSNTLYQMSKRHTNLNYREFSDDTLTGSFLCLKFGSDISIADQYLAPGSLGQYNFQYNLSITNGTNQNIQYTLYSVFLYRGVFSTERGVSATTLGVLTKEQVMAASTMRPVRSGELEMLLGKGRSGGFLGMLASLLPGLISGVSSLMSSKSGSGVSGGASKIQNILDKYSM